MENSIHLAQTLPTVNITSAITIPLPFNASTRTMVIPISITGANTVSVLISTNTTNQTTPFNNQSITIPTFPSDSSSFVDVA